MDRLRSALFESRTLEARQQVDDLLAKGTPLQHILSMLHACAACARDPAFGAAGTAHGLTWLYGLDRSIGDLERLGLLQPALYAAVDFLGGLKLEEIPPLPGRDADVATLPQDFERGDVTRLAGALLALENPRTERAARTALLEVTRAAAGPFGHRLVDVAAFLRGFERADKEDRAILAHAYARDLVHGTDDGTRDDGDAPTTPAESSAAALPSAPEPPTPSAPLPGSASAGELLAHLRAFHHPAALACLDALVAAGRDEEALTVLLQRAEEHAGPRWHHLLFADALRETFPVLGDARGEVLRDLTERLLRIDPDDRLVERLADGISDEPLKARERNARDERLVDAMVRRDRDAALETAGALLADEDGGERVRRAVLSGALAFEDAHAPRAFAAVSALVAIGRAVGWPASRGALLRAVYLLTVEREP